MNSPRRVESADALPLRAALLVALALGLVGTVVAGTGVRQDPASPPPSSAAYVELRSTTAWPDVELRRLGASGDQATVRTSQGPALTSPAVSHVPLAPVSSTARVVVAPTSISQTVVTNRTDTAEYSARVIVKLRNSTVAQHAPSATSSAVDSLDESSGTRDDPALAALLAQHAVRAVSPLFIGHARTTTRLSRSSAERAAAVGQHFPARAARAPSGSIVPDLSRTYILELDSRSPSEVEATIQSIRANPDVIYAEEDRLVEICYIPNDPSYSKSGSWGQSYDDLHGLKTIGTTAAWDTTQGQGIVVAVIDTGVDYEHPDIKDNIWLNTREIPGNGIDDDDNGFVDDVVGWDFAGQHSWQQTEDADPMDTHGHGTHVAGTIAATGDNGVGVVGVAWKAEIMIVKGLDDNGSGPESQLARSIMYAVDNGADVINASWGRKGVSETLTDAVNYAHAHGVVFVAAAGNSTSNASQFSPANIPAAIAVAALDPFGNGSYFSNFGSRIDVAAPGQDILSLEAATAAYTRKDGTSMAAPHVSGVTALILACHPTFSVEQVRQALRTSATDLGATGKDPKFGYGRIDAAAAVLLAADVLDARILSPNEGTAIAGSTALSGSAGGPGFARYVLEFGAGAAPDSWTTFRESTAVVSDSELGAFDPSALPDGLYTIRLRAISASGATFSDQIQIFVRYLQITSPLPPPVPSLTQQMKPGCAYTITGSARGPSFQNYVIEWAPGPAATSGWSTEGFTLSDDGRSPVDESSLGTWALPASLEGYYTIRLTVNNSGFSSVSTSSAYAEPALVAAGWPVILAGVPDDLGPTLVRRPDGSSRFVYLDRQSRTLYALSYDGSVETMPLGVSYKFLPTAADLDGQPGDEIVVPDGFSIEILSSSLERIRKIPAPPGRYFGYDQITLADLDNDGVVEILAPSRSNDASFSAPGMLHIYRTDGTLFSDIAVSFDVTSPFCHTQVAAADLDGDGFKEIVMATGALDQSHYTLAAFNGDGSPWSGWSPIYVSDTKLSRLSVADLDNDGVSEIVILGNEPTSTLDRIVVLNGTGAVRDGWPVSSEDARYSWSRLSIGDLDRDGHKEIVWVTESMLSILSHDGSSWCKPWSIGGNPPYNSLTEPLLADIDGDGIQEILAVISSVNFDDPSTPFHYSTLTVYDRAGVTRGSWPMFGAAGQQPVRGTPAVGDFNADGKTDLSVTMSLIEGGGISGWLINSSMTCLTTDTLFNGPGSDWVSNHSDPQYSRTPHAAPSFIVRPESRTASAGAAVTLTTRVSGHPYPRIQWQKDGVDIPGATNAMLTFRSVQAWDAGHYSVVVSSSSGSITSEATLAVADVSAADARALNLSTRAFVRGPDQPLIPGFVVAGTGTKQLLIRAVGPTLRAFGVGSAIDDPRIILKRYDPITKAYLDLAANEDWPEDEALKAASAAVGAFSLAPASRDAAMLFDAAPGSYTVIAQGAGENATGIALVEVYDADPVSGAVRLVNVSNRGYIGVGNDIMIAGFVISNEGPKKLLIRTVGPGLAAFNVPDALMDPQLTLYRTIDGSDASEVILANDNWSNHPDAATTASTAEAVGAFPLETGSKDAAFVAALRPGVYTVHATGVAGATGEALVELYIVP